MSNEDVQDLYKPPDSRPSNEPILTVKERKNQSKMIPKEKVMPTWAATKSLVLSCSSDHQPTTNTEVIAPLFKTSPTDYATLHTVLMLTQGISAYVVGPERRTIITLDLDLYSRALKIQQTTRNTNWILRAGGLHIIFAALHALGKTIDGSGIDLCAIESGTYTSAALRGIYGGKAYKRGIEYHITTSLAIMMMRFDAILSVLPPGPVGVQCAALREALHERNPELVGIYNQIESWYSTNIKPHEDTEHIGELGQFFTEYLEQFESILHIITACRSKDWEGYLSALENVIKCFFSRDLLNYARLMPVHLAQMNALEHEDPTTWEALKSGDFVVAKSEVPFTHLFTDQTLEQEIEGLKRHGGMVGLSQDDNGLDRLVTTTPYLAHIVKQYINNFPQTSQSSHRKEHYQLSGDVATRTRANAVKLRESIEVHCATNPFIDKTPLKSLVSSALVPESMKDDLLRFAEKGQSRFEEFIGERLMPKSTVSVWDSMKKIKLKAFSNMMDKSKLRVGDKIVKIREERQLLGRFLTVQKSRPELVLKLEETIGEYEMSVLPRSICAGDGSLLIPTNKASLIHAIEEAKTPAIPSVPIQDTTPLIHPYRVLIVDVMAVLQGMKKTPTMKTF